MVAAAWQHPPAGGVTIQHISDTHVVDPGGTAEGWAYPRLQEIAVDMAESAALANVAARVHTGDMTEHGSSFECGQARGWLQDNMGSASDIWVYGNHDYGNGWSTYMQDRAAVEAKFGRPALQDAYAGPAGAQVRVLGFAPGDFPGGNAWTIPQDTLDWLDARLAEDTSTPTILACHETLQEMAGIAVGNQTQPASAFDAMVSDYPQVTAWLCGHFHYVTTDPNCVSSLAIGNRTAFPHICGPSTSHTRGTASYAYDARYPYRSLFVTYVDADRIEVRYRDHGSRSWATGENGELLTVLTPA